MPFIIRFDRLEFPLIKREDWNFYISLVPVTKYQFEEFMIERGPIGELFTNNWYKEILSLNPRKPSREFKKCPWKIFITGVSETEINHYLSFLGRNFRIPTSEEWLKLYDATSEIKDYKSNIINQCKGKSKLLGSLLDNDLFPLTKVGIFEMINDNGNIRYIGKPFPEFHDNVWTPNVVRELNWDKAKKLVGFRVVLVKGD